MPKLLIFDSGLGGLTVHRAIVARRSDLDIVYFADDQAFPYGALAPDALVDRVLGLMHVLVARHRPDLVVIACNTASTLVLPACRAAFPALPFVGTVPAIKPAAEATRSALISVLATPGTVARDYTRDLVARFAGHAEVTLVGSAALAPLAEASMAGEDLGDAAILNEIAPCFVQSQGRRTDHVVLACTHYPLLLDRFERVAPWPVTWIDPAPAIARQVDTILGAARHAGAVTGEPCRLLYWASGRTPTPTLARMIRPFGLRPFAATPVEIERRQGALA